MRKRKVQKYGNSWIIKLNPIDIKDFNLEIGDEVDLEDIVIVKGGEEKKNGK